MRVCSHLHPFHFELNSKCVECVISPPLWGLVWYHTQTTNYEVDCRLPDVPPGESDIFLWAGRRNERQSRNKGIWITVFSGEAKLLCLPSSLRKNKTGTKVQEREGLCCIAYLNPYLHMKTLAAKEFRHCGNSHLCVRWSDSPMWRYSRPHARLCWVWGDCVAGPVEYNQGFNCRFLNFLWPPVTYLLILKAF